MIHFRVNLARKKEKKKKEEEKEEKEKRENAQRENAAYLDASAAMHALRAHYKTPLKSGTVVNT